MSIFLTETSIRHSMLYKHKHFRDTTQTKLTSNSRKLVGASREAPVNIEDGETENQTPPPAPMLRVEDDDDDVVALRDIPTLDEGAPCVPTAAPKWTSKRRRGTRTGTGPPPPGNVVDEHESTGDLITSDEDHDLFVSQDQDESEDDDTRPPSAKRRKDDASAPEHETVRDDKKKLAMDISYEGFSIYGRVLCLVVKRRGDGANTRGKGKGGAATGGQQQAMMENWITSTQMPEAVANGLLEAT